MGLVEVFLLASLLSQDTNAKQTAATPGKSVAVPNAAISDDKRKAADAKQTPTPREATPLPTAPVPTVLAARDVRTWNELAKRLQVLGEANLRPVAGLWSQLREPARTAARNLAKGPEQDADRDTLSAALNQLLRLKDTAKSFGFTPDDLRDFEAKFLLERLALISDAEGRRLNRLLFETAFPFEVASQPPEPRLAAGDRQLYPPTGNPTTANAVPAAPTVSENVTLDISLPQLRGKLLAVFETGNRVLFDRDAPQRLTVPNRGSLRFRFPGDDVNPMYGRTLTWDASKVVAGTVLPAQVRL